MRLNKPATIWYTKTIDEATMKRASVDPVLRHLLKILKQRIDDLEQSERREEAYEDSSWAYRQAHKNGRLQELTSLINLLSFAETKTPNE